jgi:hypothetical protein
MEMLHEAYRDLASADEGQEEPHAVRIRTLCQVMTSMFIPEGVMAQLVNQLEMATRVPIIADVAYLVHEDIQRLMGRLMYNE